MMTTMLMMKTLTQSLSFTWRGSLRQRSSTIRRDRFLSSEDDTVLYCLITSSNTGTEKLLQQKDTCKWIRIKVSLDEKKKSYV